MDTRLKEVHQTDLTEGRLNQDFADWLQTKGISWLLVILVFLCVYFIYIRWRGHQISFQTEAWRELSSASLPNSLEDVADKYAKVGSVADLARLRAAEALLNAVQSGKGVGPANETQKELTDQERDDYLSRADRQYARVLEGDDGTMPKTLIAVTALTGRATVAECRGDLEQARAFYTRAAERAKDVFPKLAEQARQRAETVTQHGAPITLPTNAQIASAAAQPKPPTIIDEVKLEPWARDLIMPKDES